MAVACADPLRSAIGPLSHGSPYEWQRELATQATEWIAACPNVPMWVYTKSYCKNTGLNRNMSDSLTAGGNKNGGSVYFTWQAVFVCNNVLPFIIAMSVCVFLMRHTGRSIFKGVFQLLVITTHQENLSWLLKSPQLQLTPDIKASHNHTITSLLDKYP